MMMIRTSSRPCARWLAIAVLAVTTCTSRAVADVQPATVALVQASANAWAAWTSGHHALPRSKERQTKSIFDALDGTPVRAAAPYGPGDLMRLFAMQKVVTPLTRAYLAAPGPDGKPDPIGNEIKYEDELTRLAAFDLDLTAAALRSIEPFFRALPSGEVTQIRLDGAKMVREGAADVVKGTLMMAWNPRLTVENGRILAGALASNAQALTGSLDAEVLVPLQQSALNLAKRALDPQMRAALSDFGTAKIAATR